MQGFVPAPGTLVGNEDPPRAVIPPALACTLPLRPSFVPGVGTGLPPTATTLCSVSLEWDRAALPTTPSCDRPSWGPWLQGLC